MLYGLTHAMLALRKQMAIEVDNLNARVVEAETRLKSEVTKIKKKMQVTITELEMSLDTANKCNIDLQKTVKKQSITLQVSPLSILLFFSFSIVLSIIATLLS